MKNYKDTENRILGDLLRRPLISKSLRQIALDTKLMYVTVHKIVPILLKRNTVKQEKKGKANLISIDFEYAKLEDISSNRPLNKRHRRSIIRKVIYLASFWLLC